MEKATYRCNKDDIDVDYLVELITKYFKKYKIYEIIDQEGRVSGCVEKTYYDTKDKQVFYEHGVCRKVVYNVDDPKNKFAILQYTPSMYYALETYKIEDEDLTSDELSKILETNQEMKPVAYLNSEEKHLFFSDEILAGEKDSLNEALVECVVKAIKVYNAKKEYVNNVVLIQIRDKSLDVQNETLKESLEQRVARSYEVFGDMMNDYKNEKVNRSMNSFIKQLVIYPKRISDLEK